MIPQQRLDEIKARCDEALEDAAEYDADFSNPDRRSKVRGNIDDARSKREPALARASLDLLAEVDRLQLKIRNATSALSVSSDEEADTRDKGGAIDMALGILRAN
jgi:hypothetical protein